MGRVAGTLEKRTNGTHRAEGKTPHALIRVFVPSADRFGRPLDHSRIIEAAERLLLSMATGITSIPADGAWMNGHPTPLRERVRILEAYVPRPIRPDSRRRLLAGLREIAGWANQEALLVVIAGRPIVLEPRSQLGVER